MPTIEVRVRPVERYIVTKYETEDPREDGSASKGVSSQIGEYENCETAMAVGYAIAAAEHARLGYPQFDDRIQYPRHPHAVEVESQA